MIVILVVLECVIFNWYNDSCPVIKYGFFRVVKILSTTMVEKYAEDSFSLSLFLKEIVKLSDIHDF